MDLSSTNSAKDLKLTNGDFVRVPRISDQYINPLVLSGEVVREGTFAWKPGLRISSYLGDLDRDYREQACSL